VSRVTTPVDGMEDVTIDDHAKVVETENMTAPVNEWTETIDGQADIAKKQLELMEKQYKLTEDLAKAMGANHEIGADGCDYEKFKKMSPPFFNGDLDRRVLDKEMGENIQGSKMF